MTKKTTALLRKISRLNRRLDKKSKNRVVASRGNLYEFDASFCITGIGLNPNSITLNTSLSPTHTHIEGEFRSKFTKRTYKEDMWSLRSPLEGSSSLDEHIAWLWIQLKPHKQYLTEVISKSTSAYIILGCLTESPYPILDINIESTKILRELNLSLAFNFTCV
jgi:Domain of unknown function (DUF4279)